MHFERRKLKESTPWHFIHLKKEIIFVLKREDNLYDFELTWTKPYNHS